MKKAIITLVVLAGLGGAVYGTYRAGYLQNLQKEGTKMLGKVIPALRQEETEGLNSAGRVSSTDPDAVYLDQVSILADLGSGDGLIEKFSGKVEPQETKKYSIPSDRKLDQTFVQEGDDVKKGDKLFSYDVDSMKDKLEQAKIDLERLQNSVDVSEAKQKELDKQLQNANTPEKKLQALEAANSLKQQKLELKSKQAKIDSINQQIENSIIVADIDGIVKSVNQNAANEDSGDSYSSAGDGNTSFITLLKVGTYRIKASCNEQNIGSIFVGESMIAYSRVDPSVSWRGTVSQIKTDQGAGNSDNDAYNQDSGSGSTNYPFYIELESSDGLMLGQHVFLEQDLGQADKKDGIWLDNYYLVREDDGSVYVWAASDDNRLEKRKIETGETDEEEQKTEIKKGLYADDYICLPADNLKEGLPVAYNDDAASAANVSDDYTYLETEDPALAGMMGAGYGSPLIGADGELDVNSIDFGDETEWDLETEEDFAGDGSGQSEVEMVPIQEADQTD